MVQFPAAGRGGATTFLACLCSKNAGLTWRYPGELVLLSDEWKMFPLYRKQTTDLLQQLIHLFCNEVSIVRQSTKGLIVNLNIRLLS